MRIETGLLFIISAASGTGKTTRWRAARADPAQPPHVALVYVATGAPASGTASTGFVSREHFEGMINRGEFLEWADVFGNLYGTSRPDAERLQASGQDVVLVIDVQGAAR